MNAELETPGGAPLPKRRRGDLGSLLALLVAGVLLLLSVFAIWIDRVALQTDTFVDTSTELIQDDAIRQAVATRAVDELFDSVDVEAEIEQQLPKDFKSLSGPATAGLREASYRLVDRALRQPVLQRLWALSLEQSHRALVDVLEGDGRTLSTDEGVVTLDLERIVLEAAERIGIRRQVEGKLPADVGRIEVLRSDELDVAQDAFRVLKTLAWVLPVLMLIAFSIAIWLAADRRRAIRRTGVVLLAAGVGGLLAANLVGNYLVDNLASETENRHAASDAWGIVTGSLRASFFWLIVVGPLFVAAAWLAGPGARAVAARRALAPAVRERFWAYAVLALLVVALLLSSPVSDFARLLVLVLVVALGIVWIELVRAQTTREFPDASGVAFLADVRDRISEWWTTLRIPSPRPGARPPGSDVAARLAQLAELHRNGDLTDAEYAAAKARVLAGE